MPAGSRVLVITPTYNEVESLDDTVRHLLETVPTVDVLVVDDASPDGTGELADSLAAEDARIHVLHRPGKQGLGRAYVDGFRWALDAGYDTIVEFDADGSHPASELGAMLRVLAAEPRTGLVIGSRWVAGGTVVDWSASRRRLSTGGNAYARGILGVPVRDITAGYRAYRAEVLRALDLGAIDSRGYCFQIDMTLRVLDAGWAVAEVPIAFRERRAGRSKMNSAIVIEAMVRVTGWGARRRLTQARRSSVVDIRQQVPPTGGR